MHSWRRASSPLHPPDARLRNVPAKEKDEILGAVSTLKKDIVEKP